MAEDDRVSAEPGAVCELCGRRHMGCMGHRMLKRGPQPCGRPVRYGKRFCKQHLTTIITAKRQRLYAKGHATISDPLPVIQRLMGDAVAWLNLVEEKLAGLQSDEWRFTDDKGAEQLRSEVAILERAMERAQKFAQDLARLGLEERLVMLEEEKARIVMAAFTAALESAGIPQEKADVIAIDFAAGIRRSAA